MERQRSLLTMCCEEQERLDQYETREISLESQLERVKMSKTSVWMGGLCDIYCMFGTADKYNGFTASLA